MATTEMEVLRFDNLEQYLFVKNGNYLYKVPYHGGFAVLKVYWCSRGWFERISKTFDNIVIAGQTSFMPRARLRTEQDAMAIWREAGFRVFKIYENVRVEGIEEGGYALYEYVPGRHFHKLLPDESVPREERIRLYRKFLVEWHRRHRLAIDRREPRLIHENGDLKHVMDYNGELVWFDFEMCYRSRSHVEDLVAREILAYAKSIGDFMKGELFELFLNEMVEHYPDKDLLGHAYTVTFRNRNPVIRVGRNLEFMIRERAKRWNSKYNMALMIRDRLARLHGQGSASA